MVTVQSEPSFVAADKAKYSDILGDDAPPKATPRKTTAPRKAPASTSKDVSLPQVREALLNMYTMVGAGLLSTSRTAPVGQAVFDAREACVDAIINAAEKDARLRAMLGKLVTTSVYGQIAVAHAPIIMAIYFTINQPAVIAETVTDPEDTTAPKTRWDVA